MDPIAGRVHIFEKVTIGSPPNQYDMGRIVRVVDRNGNQLIYTYGAAEINELLRAFGIERLLPEGTENVKRDLPFAIRYSPFSKGGKL
jgi:hypothetical protein